MLDLEGQVLFNVALLGILLVHQGVVTHFNFPHPLISLLTVQIVFDDLNFGFLKISNKFLINSKLFHHRIHPLLVRLQIRLILSDARFEVVDHVLVKVQLLLE